MEYISMKVLLNLLSYLPAVSKSTVKPAKIHLCDPNPRPRIGISEGGDSGTSISFVFPMRF